MSGGGKEAVTNRRNKEEVEGRHRGNREESEMVEGGGRKGVKNRGVTGMRKGGGRRRGVRLGCERKIKKWWMRKKKLNVRKKILKKIMKNRYWGEFVVIFPICS